MTQFRPRPGCVMRAYRFALDPNTSQENALRSHCGAARAAYNWAVGWVTAVWWQRAAEQSYGVADEALTEWRSWSLPTLRKAFNAVKRTDPRFASWWEENSKEAYSTGLANASAAFDNYAASRRGTRRGTKMGAPRFKSKRKARLACRFTTGSIRVEADALHKLTTSVTADYGTVVVEDLNVAGMLRNRRLARRIADAGFGEVRRQLTYKTGWYGSRLVVADRWFPSSKICSGCGAVKAKLPLHVRAYRCDTCGLSLDRDDNAARNLAALAACTTGTGVAGDQDTAPVVWKPRGADQRTRVTHTRHPAGAGRAGGATPPRQRRAETRDRPHAEARTLR